MPTTLLPILSRLYRFFNDRTMDLFSFILAIATAAAPVENGMPDNTVVCSDSIVKPLTIKKATMNEKAVATESQKKLETKDTRETSKPTQAPKPEPRKSVEQPQPSAPEKKAPRTARSSQGAGVENTDKSMPSFPGGEKAIREFVRNNKRYPAECQKERAAGKVTITMTITTDGTPKDPAVTESSGNKLLDAEALRLATIMPKWQAAKDKKNAKERTYTMTISFRPGR